MARRLFCIFCGRWSGTVITATKTTRLIYRRVVFVAVHSPVNCVRKANRLFSVADKMTAAARAPWRARHESAALLYKEKSTCNKASALSERWQLPNFPCVKRHSIIGVRELNYCVRDGNRWILSAIITTMVY